MRPSTGTGRSPLLALVAIAIGLLAVGCGSDDGTAVEGGRAETVDDTDDADDADAGDAGAQAGDDQEGEDVAGPGSADDADAGGTDPDDGSQDVTGELFPDVIGATAERGADGLWTFSATLSSPYDTPKRYADAWRVLGPDGEVYGIRELAHDHANEQPFTRSQSGIEIPEDVTVVTVEGRDQISGWGGATVEVELER